MQETIRGVSPDVCEMVFNTSWLSVSLQQSCLCLSLWLTCILNCVFFSPLCSVCPTTAGPGGPGAQRLSPAVCLREAEGPAGDDGGPGLRGPDGDRGHRDCQAAPRVPPRPLNHSGGLSLQSITTLHTSLPKAYLCPPPLFKKPTGKGNNLGLFFVWVPDPNLPNLYPC